MNRNLEGTELMELERNYLWNSLSLSLSLLFIYIFYTLVPQVPKIFDFTNFKKLDFWQKSENIYGREIYGTYGTKKIFTSQLIGI